MRILDRYILQEMFMPFLFGLMAFTSLFVGADLVRLVQLVTDLGAPLGAALRLLVLRLPQVFIWTSPMAVLLATLLSLSRLSANSEIVAMQAGGISLYRIIGWVTAAGAAVGLATLLLGEWVVPWANGEYNRVMMEEVQRNPAPTVTYNVILTDYKQGVLAGFLYAAKYDRAEARMTDVTLVAMEGGRPVETTFARQVVWDGNAWYMEDGVIHRHGHEEDQRTTSMAFREGRQPVSIGYGPEDVVRAQRSPEEMSMAELREHIAILESQGQDVRRQLVQLHLKVAVPAASLVFALVGAPLAIQSHRSAVSIGFGLSVVLIFIYYVLMTMGSALAQGGHLPPVLGAWVQNIILGGCGLLLVWRRAGR